MLLSTAGAVVGDAVAKLVGTRRDTPILLTAASPADDTTEVANPSARLPLLDEDELEMVDGEMEILLLSLLLVVESGSSIFRVNISVLVVESTIGEVAVGV